MAIPTGRNQVEFCFRFGRWSWRETYWDALNNTLTASLAKAKPLARVRIALLGNDGTVEGSPKLERVVVSNDAITGDSEQTTEFEKETPNIAVRWIGDLAAPPDFCMEWRTTNITGFARTRYMGGIPAVLLGNPAPQLEPQFYGLFAKFRKELGTNSWAYLLTGAGPNKNPDQRITYIGWTAGTVVQVWSGQLPNAGQQVEIRYARFERGTVPVRGDFKVLAIGPGWFTVDMGAAAQFTNYLSGGIWRLPSSRLIDFDGSSLLVGIGAHKRGFKLHAEVGRLRPKKARVF